MLSKDEKSGPTMLFLIKVHVWFIIYREFHASLKHD